MWGRVTGAETVHEYINKSDRKLINHNTAHTKVQQIHRFLLVNVRIFWGLDCHWDKRKILKMLSFVWKPNNESVISAELQA